MLSMNPGVTISYFVLGFLLLGEQQSTNQRRGPWWWQSRTWAQSPGSLNSQETSAGRFLCFSRLLPRLVREGWTRAWLLPAWSERQCYSGHSQKGRPWSPIPEPLNGNLHFNHICRWFVCTLRCEECGDGLPGSGLILELCAFYVLPSVIHHRLFHNDVQVLLEKTFPSLCTSVVVGVAVTQAPPLTVSGCV